MKFVGDDSYLCQRGKPVYSSSLKILVLDYDDLMMLHKQQYKNGGKTSNIRHRYHNQAKQVVEHALKYFNKVVFWSSANEEVLTNFDSFPYSEAQLKILGCQSSQNGRYEKNLKILTENLTNIVAMENEPAQDEIDEETGLPFVGFAPRDRVIEVSAHEDFMRCYKAGFKILR